MTELSYYIVTKEQLRELRNLVGCLEKLEDLGDFALLLDRIEQQSVRLAHPLPMQPQRRLLRVDELDELQRLGQQTCWDGGEHRWNVRSTRDRHGYEIHERYCVRCHAVSA
ncbi:MAG TPA: hypothetical protein VH164_00315 [Ktedonobacteraceae bacterium]|jgi:hypothetical protein|nr:hypothetical protein [Ktedonobacteraceae bacterium]